MTYKVRNQVNIHPGLSEVYSDFDTYSHDPQVADGTHHTSIQCPQSLRICPSVDQSGIRKRQRNWRYNNRH